MTEILRPTILRKPLLIGFLSALCVLLLGGFMLWQRYRILVESRQREMSGIIDVVEQNIDQSLKYSYSAALSLALQIDEDGNIEDFEKFASQLVDGNPNIDAIQIVPKGVITKVYPLENNEKALGYNILADKSRNAEAIKAIEDRRMFFAGPLELKQGGLAIVGRLPVFIENEFWGFSAVIIHFENLIKQSGIRELASDKYRFQFSKINPVTREWEYFLDEEECFDESYSEDILLPDGEWKIYILPVNPNQPINTLIPVGILILVLAGSFGWIVCSAMKQPVILAERLKKRTADLAKSELRFRTIFNQAAVGMVRIETSTGMILESNKKFQELIGYTEEETKRLNYRSISHPEEIEESAELMKKLRANEIKEYHQRKRLIAKDGETIWINLNVTPLSNEGQEITSHIAIVQDISARIKAKAKLVENEKRFRGLVENSSEVILVIKDNGRVIYNSPSLKRITGYETLLLDDTEIFSLVHPQDCPYLIEKLKEANENPGVAYSEIIIRIQTKCANWIWVNATLTNLLEEKNIGGYVVNLRDITEKKEAELNLVKSYDFVMEQNKRLLNFAYIVSHNLRSHSSNLESILQLYENESCPEEKNNYVRLLQNVSRNLNQTLHDLNEVVSINNNLDIKSEEVQVSKYLDNAMEVLGLQIESKGAIIKNNIPPQMKVRFNSSYMESVLLNFLTNALRYSHPDRTPVIEVSGYKQNGNWVLEVADNGIGIDLDKHKDKVFGLYKTFSGRSDSRGVGLFITKNQVNAMGGEVGVESRPNVGTTFKVYFS